MEKNKKTLKIKRKLRNIGSVFFNFVLAAVYILLYRAQFKEFSTDVPKTAYLRKMLFVCTHKTIERMFGNIKSLTKTGSAYP